MYLLEQKLRVWRICCLSIYPFSPFCLISLGKVRARWAVWKTILGENNAIQARLAFIVGNGASDAKLTAATPADGSRLISGIATERWEDSSLNGRFANLRALQPPNFETQSLLPIVSGRPGGRGPSEGSSLLKKSAWAPTAPAASRTFGIEMLSVLRGGKGRATTFRCASPTLRSLGALLKSWNARPPDAKSCWRQLAPNSRNERHALVQESRASRVGGGGVGPGRSPHHSESSGRRTHRASQYGR
ncbi:hypothetical protein MOQ_005496 [Trypanosoma cruzi marinkellei]|uniref:Uncharacterized protein n=1 Tax=Trypanosoma cruzi marinkellei TaxID=85056 RepID=K2MY12_TRYCR|nr:hypothetical protein MOQ_005496 [Trypanosoma cruzi marinkellei]